MRTFVDRPERAGSGAGSGAVATSVDEAEPRPTDAPRSHRSERFASAQALLDRIDATEMAVDELHAAEHADLFGKCRDFQRWVGSMRDQQLYQRFYQLTLTGPVDARVAVADGIHGVEREFVCFDSNSYLGLHLHPRVLEAVELATRKVGYGTPSAPLSSGTNRYLRELELGLAEFHGRADAVVFPSGFAAGAGTLRALVRARDAVVRDSDAHASLHEGSKASGAGFIKLFSHADPASLDQVLRRAEKAGCRGKLVVTDGLFGMHGRVAPLPALVAVCRERGARLMVDDAHGVGVLGPSGGGLEEAFGMQGSVDVLMGTLSKALGSLGGYVCGSRELVDYLRWFAPSGALSTALPAPICAGARVALDLIRAEPEHRARLWDNARLLGDGLRSVGFAVPQPDSPIVALPIESQALLWKVSRELFDAGIKCGTVIYPTAPRSASSPAPSSGASSAGAMNSAVPTSAASTSAASTSADSTATAPKSAVSNSAVARPACALRLMVNARHTPEDLDYAVDVLGRIGRRHGLVERPQEAAGIGA